MRDIVMFEDAYFDEKGAWFSASTHNGLYYWDFERNTVRFMGMFPNEHPLGIRLHWGVVYCKGVLIFVPLNARFLTKYDISKGIFTCYDLSKEINLNEELFQCCSYVLVENELYLFPFRTKNVIRYNIENNEICVMKGWSERISLCMKDNKSKNILLATRWDSKDTIAACGYGNRLFLCNIKDNSIKDIVISNDKDEVFSDLTIKNDKVFLFSATSRSIYVYDYVLNKLEVYNYVCRDIGDSLNYIRGEWMNDNLFFLDQIKGIFFKFNENMKTISEVRKVVCSEYITREFGDFSYDKFKRVKDGSLILCPLAQDKLIRITPENVLQEIDISHLKMINKEEHMCELIEKSSQSIGEKYFCNLTGFISYMKLNDNQNLMEKAYEKGNNIYKELMRG